MPTQETLVIRRYAAGRGGGAGSPSRLPGSGVAAALMLSLLLLAACTDGGIGDATTSDPLPAPSSTVPTTTTPPATTTLPPGDPVLLTGHRADPDPPPQAARSRLVDLDLDVLVGPAGEPLEVGAVRLEFFDDASYRAVIDEIGADAGGITWTGHLDGIEPSHFTMVYTASTFMGHFAGPGGVFEVAFAGDGAYRIVQVDQSGLPTEEPEPGST